MDCPEAVSNYTHLLCRALSNDDFVARLDKLFLDAVDLMKTLQSLCCSQQNIQCMVESSDFQTAVSEFLLRGGEKETKCVLTLLLTCLVGGQPISMAKGKGKGGKRPMEDRRKQTKVEFLSHFSEIVSQLKYVLDGRHESVKKLCSSVLWLLQEDPG